jgi:hypothetical protein
MLSQFIISNYSLHSKDESRKSVFFVLGKMIERKLIKSPKLSICVETTQLLWVLNNCTPKLQLC